MGVEGHNGQPAGRPRDMLPLATERTDLLRPNGEGFDQYLDLVAVEEPLEIRVDEHPLMVTMRTPGHDEELCAGWLTGEGVISSVGNLITLGPPDDLSANVVDARLASDVELDVDSIERHFYTSSSCGICGRQALEAVAVHANPLPAGPSISRDMVLSLPERLAGEQDAFARTGGLHAAGLFDTEGSALVVREDVGRHNALDKAIGWALLEDRLPLNEVLICVSGRISFELVQKAAIAGAPVLAGVSAPTSLAVNLARDRGLTLCGFVRNDHMNVYATPERIRP